MKNKSNLLIVLETNRMTCEIPSDLSNNSRFDEMLPGLTVNSVLQLDGDYFNGLPLTGSSWVNKSTLL